MRKIVGVLVSSALLAGFVATSGAQASDAVPVSDAYTAYSGPVQSAGEGGGKKAEKKLAGTVAIVVIDSFIDALRKAGSPDGTLKVGGLESGDGLFDRSVTSY